MFNNYKEAKAGTVVPIRSIAGNAYVIANTSETARPTTADAIDKTESLIFVSGVIGEYNKRYLTLTLQETKDLATALFDLIIYYENVKAGRIGPDD